MSEKPNEGQVFDYSYTIGIPRPDAQGSAHIGIACGGCGHEWKDNVIVNQETRVTCPECGGTNTVTIDYRAIGI